MYLAAVLIAVMGGRIIPSFTANALRHRGILVVPMARTWREHLAAPSVAIAALTDLVAEGSLAAAAAAPVAATLHGARLAGWRPLATGFSPILWVLHAGYAWLVVGFALSGLAVFVATIPPHDGLSCPDRGRDRRADLGGPVDGGFCHVHSGLHADFDRVAGGWPPGLAAANRLSLQIGELRPMYDLARFCSGRLPFRPRDCRDASTRFP